jgi:glucose/arabinose dehydrogenase
MAFSLLLARATSLPVLPASPADPIRRGSASGPDPEQPHPPKPPRRRKRRSTGLLIPTIGLLALTVFLTAFAARGTGLAWLIKRSIFPPPPPVGFTPPPPPPVREYGHVDPRLEFERITQATATGRMFTWVEVGPDGRLWAADVGGDILRYDIAPDGTLGEPDLLDTLTEYEGGPRLMTGGAFSPDGKALYVVSAYPALLDAPDFSSRIVRITGPDWSQAKTIITGLPRSIGDHATNQPVFGPDGALYIPQASNTALGGTDKTWGMRPEHPLSATVLRLDPAHLNPQQPIDVTTAAVGEGYDPWAPGAPVTVYSEGIRLIYDLEWVDLPNRGWTLYAPTNGSSPGGTIPPDPVSGFPGLTNSTYNEHDWLHRVEPGGYHGHPNPSTGYFVLNGANPTDGPDLWEIPEYPVGTKPDPRYAPAVADLGEHESANGVILFKAVGDTFTEQYLDGILLIVRYSRSSDLVGARLDDDGNVVELIEGIPGLIQMGDPLDVCQDPRTGYLYVADFALKQIELIRPTR